MVTLGLSCTTCRISGEILKDVQKILTTALFITVKNRNSRNTRNREPAKSMMIHIMEYQAIVKSCGKLFTDRGRRWFTTEASKKQCYTVMPACFRKQTKKKAGMIHIKY